MKRTAKGDIGYIKSERLYKSLITLILFIIPLGALIIAWIYYGTNKNLITVVALVGCLPACRSLVNLIMFFTVRPLPDDIAERIREHEGGLVCAHELYLTTEDKNILIDALAICGNTIVALSTFKNPDTNFGERRITNALRAAGHSVTVNVMKDIDKYIERLDDLNRKADKIRSSVKFVPDERYPDLSNEELIKYKLMAVAL